MLRKISIFLMGGFVPIFACGPNMGSVFMIFMPYVISAGMIVWALIQLRSKEKKEEDV